MAINTVPVVKRVSIPQGQSHKLYQATDGRAVWLVLDDSDANQNGRTILLFDTSALACLAMVDGVVIEDARTYDAYSVHENNRTLVDAFVERMAGKGSVLSLMNNRWMLEREPKGAKIRVLVKGFAATMQDAAQQALAMLIDLHTEGN